MATDIQREAIAKGLKQFLNIPIIRSNQNAKFPDYPFGVYKITTPTSQNGGTWQLYEDNTARKSYIQNWSLTINSENYDEAVELANKAKNWLDYGGKAYLDANDIIIQSVGSVSDRSTLLSSDYMYSFGFDFTLWRYSVIETPNTGEIEKVTLENITVEKEEIIDDGEKDEIIAELRRQIKVLNACISNCEILSNEIINLQESYIGGE